jgi:hypothetical protein
MMKSKISAGLVVLTVVALLAGSAPIFAGKNKTKSKHWVGKPASELIAVMGAPEKERPGRSEDKKVLIWFRYPITTPLQDSDGDTASGAWATGMDVDPPPIPGDPTLQSARIIECTVTVGPGGIISKVNMPEACHVPAVRESGDDGVNSAKPELPHREESAGSGKPILPHSESDDEKPPPQG